MNNKPAGASPIDQPVRPCAWWVPAFSEPLVSRGETKPMLWPEAKPLYELAPDEVAAVNKFRARKEWMKRDTARCEPPTAGAVLAPAAHIYQGYCPDELAPDARDPECPACLAMAPNAKDQARAEGESPGSDSSALFPKREDR